MGNVKNKQKRGEEMSVFYRDIDVKISNYKSELSKPLVVYERDRGLEIYFNLIEYAYKLDKNPKNLLENLVGAYATVTLVNPDGYEISIDEVEITEDAKVKFVITEDLTDELTEIGTYQLQIHVNNDIKGRDTSVFSIPPFNFEVIERLKGKKSELLDSEGNRLTDEGGYQLVSATSNKVINFSANQINKYLSSIPTIQGKIKDLNSQLDTKANEVDLNVERKRIDNFTRLTEGSTTGDAELIDGRVGADGTSYTLIGNNIRATSKNVNSLISNVFNFKNEMIMNLLNKDNMTDGKLIDANGHEADQTGCSFTNEYLFLKSGETITINFATYFTIAKYGTNKVFKTNMVVNDEDLPYSFTVTEDCYIRFNVYEKDKEKAMVIKGKVLPNKYITYGEKIPYTSELTFGDFQKVYNVINENYITNLLNKNNMTDGKILDANGGEIEYTSATFTNDYLLIRKGESIILNFATYFTIPKYDLNKKFIENIVVNNEDVPYIFLADNDYYLRFNVYEKDKEKAMVIKGKILPNNYIPYGEYIMKNTNKFALFENVLSGNYLFVGDSICHGAGANEPGGYAKLIAKYNKNMTYKNISVSGAILCRRVSSDNGSTVLEQIETEASLSNSYNHVVLEGGINDIWNMDKYPLGEFDRYNKNSELDETTICGAFESIIRKSKNAWNDAIIYYIIPHLMSAELATPVFDTLIEICKKYAVIVIDLRYLSGEDVSIDYVKKTYTLTNGVGDGVHNNDLGYEKFYIKPIINILSNYQY